MSSATSADVDSVDINLQSVRPTPGTWRTVESATVGSTSRTSCCGQLRSGASTVRTCLACRLAAVAEGRSYLYRWVFAFPDVGWSSFSDLELRVSNATARLIQQWIPGTRFALLASQQRHPMVARKGDELSAPLLVKNLTTGHGPMLVSRRGPHNLMGSRPLAIDRATLSRLPQPHAADRPCHPRSLVANQSQGC